MTIRRVEHGFSLVEVSIVVCLVASLSVMVVQSIHSLAGTQVYTKNQARVTETSERLVQEFARDLRYAVRCFTESSANRVYLDYFDLPTARILPGSRMPVVGASGVFDVDPVGKDQTGNLLVFVATDRNVVIDLSERQDGSDIYRVDTYRVNAYFVVQRADGRLDLGRWSSRPMARLSDITSIADGARRLRAGQRLGESGVTTAWDSSVGPETAFYLIEPSSGGLTQFFGDPVALGAPVETDPERSVTELLVKRAMEVGRNGCPRAIVPRFARGTPQFPHGFEIKLDGSHSSKLMLVRLVVAARHGSEITNAVEVTRVVSLHDV